MIFLYAADENYIRHAAASMVSLCEQARAEDTVDIHLLSMGIRPESQEKLRRLVGRYGRTLTLHELGDLTRWFDFPVNPRGFQLSALARLFAGRVLPPDAGRVLYLDCDTIVTAPLSDLETFDMHACPLAMVAEPTANKARRASLGMAEDQLYFNSGVLLIDLPRWRAEGTEQTVIGYYCAKGGALLAPDQDALNGALPGKIAALPPRYNFGSVQIYYPWRAQRKMCAPAPFYRSDSEYRAAAFPPAIVHFLGEERPWRGGNRHPYRDAYLAALQKTPWADTPQEKGWSNYFRAFYLFSALTRPFPMLRWHIIDALIPAFMRRREKQRTEKSKQQG